MLPSASMSMLWDAGAGAVGVQRAVLQSIGLLEARGHVGPLDELVLRRAHHEMRRHAQRIFHVALGALEAVGAELVGQELH